MPNISNLYAHEWSFFFVIRPTQLLLFIYQSIQTCLPIVFFRIMYFVLTEILRSWEHRSHCQNDFGNAVPRRSRWKRFMHKNKTVSQFVTNWCLVYSTSLQLKVSIKCCASFGLLIVCCWRVVYCGHRCAWNQVNRRKWLLSTSSSYYSNKFINHVCILHSVIDSHAASCKRPLCQLTCLSVCLYVCPQLWS